jgi:tetratricopeptide (TPR) repeat protein
MSPHDLLETALAHRGEGNLLAAGELCRAAELRLSRTDPGCALRVQALTILGGVLRDRGETEDALEVLELGATLARRLDRDGVELVRARVVQALAVARRHRGEFATARELLLEALSYAQAAQEAEHAVCDVLNDLGMACKSAGRFDDAESAYVTALLRCESLEPGRRDWIRATLLHNLAANRLARGDFEGAEVPASAGLDLRISLHGLGHLAVAADRAALAPILHALGKDDEARLQLEASLAVLRARLGDDHLEVAFGLHNLATLLADRGDDVEAEQALRRSLQIKQASLGPLHPDLAVSLHNLGVLLSATGREDEAFNAFRRAAGLLDGVVQPDHPTLRACRERLAAPTYCR